MFFSAFSKNAGRAESVLEQTGLSDYLLKPMSSIPTNVNPIDYTQVLEKLHAMRKDSFKYLSEI